MHYGPAIEQNFEGSPDRAGSSGGAGLNLAYYTGDTIHEWVFRLKIGYHSVAGLVGIRHFSQEVPGLQDGDPGSYVSLRAYIPSYRAGTVALMAESGPLWGPLSNRWRFGGGIGLMRLSREAPRREWYEQTLDGEEVALLNPRGETFNVRDGEIRRFRRGFPEPAENNGLRRYQAYAEIQTGYQVTPYLQLFAREVFALGTLGRRYGNADDEVLLGRIDQLQIGLLGRF